MENGVIKGYKSSTGVSNLFGILLSPKDRSHFGYDYWEKLIEDIGLKCVDIDTTKSIYDQGSFAFIIHKASDYIKSAAAGNLDSIRLLNELKSFKEINPSIIFIDPVETVLDLADRGKMFSIMEHCQFSYNDITVDVPRWTTLKDSSDVDQLHKSSFEFPIICKIMCAGEGKNCHSMQILFSPSQLDNLKVFPCVAQEFKNHGASMCKIFVIGPEYFTCTRPSVRNFPINGLPIHQTDPVYFQSHDVAKLGSKTFLNDYQRNFVLKNSLHGDYVMDDEIAKQIIRKLSQVIQFTSLGIDILIRDDGKRYSLVDINYLPSYDGVNNMGQRMLNIIREMFKQGKYINYWNS